MNNVRSVFHRGIDYTGYYIVNDIGVVSSLDRVDCAGRHLKGKVLKQIVAPNGYVQVALSINGKPRTARVHEIVARAFPEICGEWFEGAEINHKDENPLNNIATNLEWCTSKYNTNYGGHNRRMQLSLSKEIIQYSLDGCFLKKWESSEQAAKELNLSGSNIRKCCKINNRYKTVGGYIWRYSPK